MAALLEPSTPETGFRSELGATVRLALPLILGGFAQMAINTVDVLILGRYDVAALAASALALNLLWAMAIFGIGVVTAASPLIAAERGRRPHSVREVRRTVRQAWWASAFLCVPIWLVAWHAEAVFLLLGQEPALASAAAGFLRIAMWGTLPFLLYVVLRLYVTALERPVWGLVVTAGGVAFNALSCWTLVFGHFGFPELGLTGAAIANFLANLFLFLGIQEADAAQPGGLAAASRAQDCGDVVVQFKPEGSGGAHAIQATNVSCNVARSVAKSCVKGTVAGGWTATTWDGKVTLAKADKKVRYTGVGGGGCGFQQQGCHDFGYRGVGFFGLEAVGISCGGAKEKAKALLESGKDYF